MSSTHCVLACDREPFQLIALDIVGTNAMESLMKEIGCGDM